MGLQKCGLNLNRVRKELQPHGTIEFPCSGYAECRSGAAEDIIPWHWHEELEISYVKSGGLQLKTPSESHDLKEGDCIILNSNILHYGTSASGCELQSMVFHPKLITGSSESVFAQKYILPLVSCCTFKGYVFGEEERQTAERDFTEAFAALERDVPGFEFIVRNRLSDICLYTYRHYVREIETATIELDRDQIRIKEMLDYIHNNYASDLTVAEIAKAADVSERECLRCFQRNIQLSPVQYLLKYRITQGASLLVNSPFCTVSEISTLCGFNSLSNFSKLFKRFYGTTPRAYRERQKIS